MADPNFLSVNFANMNQLVEELASHHAAAVSTLNDLVANLATTLPEANWAGPGGRDHWQAVQNQWTTSMGRMHTILNGAVNLTAESSQNWPAVEQAVTGLFT